MLPEPGPVLERGAQARALLQTDVFQTAMRDLEAYHVTAMLACRPVPSETEARDYHHATLHVLRDLAATLMGYVEAADEIEKSLSEETDEEPEEY